MSAAMVGLPSGALIGGWQVVKGLGEGGFAIVHLVERNGRHYALKLARHREASDDDKHTHARTLREVAILLMLGEHPNIIKPCGYGYLPDAPGGNVYLVLEYVEGWTLAEWVERKHPTAHEVLRVFSKIAAALAYMHSRGVLHRDLKLSNVLIRKSDGEPIIIDFSCATFAQADELTDGGLPPGTDRYRAPEAFRFLREHNDASRARYAFQVSDEIFAFGAMLYEVLTDPRPTEVRTRPTLNNVNAAPPPARHSNPRVPEALSDLVESLLSRNPTRRPVDTEALQRDLGELLADPSEEYRVPVHLPSAQRKPAASDGGEPAVLEPTSKAHFRPPRAVRGWVAARVRRSGKALALGAVAVAVVLAAVLLRFHRGQAPAPPVAPRVEAAPAPSVAAPVAPPLSAPAMSQAAPAPAVHTGPAATADAHKEGSTVKTQPPEATKQARAPRGQKPPTSSALCKALLPVAAIAAGCPGVPVRPEPFDCPEGARTAMVKELHWMRQELGEFVSVSRFEVTMDDRWKDRAEVWFHPGDTVIGIVPKSIPYKEQMQLAPPGTRFYGGKVYVSTKEDPEGRGAVGRVYVKYDRVKLPGQDEVPICFIAETAALQVKDGAAQVTNRAEGEPVNSWR